MTRVGSARRSARAESGQALIFVALGMVAMIAVVGLAIDGGKEAGNYRFAQNASDGGALAGATRIYESGATATKPQLCDLAVGVAPVVVLKNPPATPTACHPLTTTSWVAAGPNGFSGSASLVTIDAAANATLLGVPLACVNAHLGVDDVTGTTNSTPSPTASGTLDLGQLSAGVGALGSCNNLLGIPVTVLNCASSVPPGTTMTGPSPADPCSPNTNLGLNVTVAGIGLVNVNTLFGLPTSIAHTLLIQQTTSSVPPTSQPAQATSSQQVLGVTGLTLAGVGSVTASAGSTAVQVGTTPPSGQPGVDAHVNLANVSATLGGVGVSITAADMHATVSYVPGVGLVPAVSCTAATITVGVQTRTVGSDCKYSLINVPGVLSVASSITSPPCTPAGGGLMQCDVNICLLQVTMLPPLSALVSATICLGSAAAHGTFKPVTQVAAVEVLDSVATPTYFLRVIGITQTHPATTAAAMPEQVVDESSSNFASAPFAAQYVATARSDPSLPTPAYCTAAVGVLEPIIPGCVYQLYNTAFGSVDPNPGANNAVCSDPSNNCWHGGLAGGSQHRVGQTVTFTGSPGVLNANYGTYALLPILDNTGGSAQTVREYGLFAINALNGTGRLVRTPDPLSSVVITPIQSESTTTWAPGWLGAVAVKLVDAAYLKNTLGFIET